MTHARAIVFNRCILFCTAKQITYIVFLKNMCLSCSLDVLDWIMVIRVVDTLEVISISKFCAKFTLSDNISSALTDSNYLQICSIWLVSIQYYCWPLTLQLTSWHPYTWQWTCPISKKDKSIVQTQQSKVKVKADQQGRQPVNWPCIAM